MAHTPITSKTPITCKEAALLLASGEEAEGGVHEHLASCGACSELAAEQLLLWELLLEDGPLPAPSAEFTQRVVAEASIEAGGRVVPITLWRVGSALLAAGLLIAVVVAVQESGPAQDGSDEISLASQGTPEELTGDDAAWAASVDELLEDLAEEDRFVVAFLDIASSEGTDASAVDSEGKDDEWLVEQIEGEDEVTASDLLALELAADLGDF